MKGILLWMSGFSKKRGDAPGKGGIFPHPSGGVALGFHIIKAEENCQVIVH